MLLDGPYLKPGRQYHLPVIGRAKRWVWSWPRCTTRLIMDPDEWRSVELSGSRIDEIDRISIRDQILCQDRKAGIGGRLEWLFPPAPEHASLCCRKRVVLVHGIDIGREVAEAQ